MMNKNVKDWFVEIVAVILNLLLGLIVLLVSRSSDVISADSEFLVIATVASLTILLLVIKHDMVRQVWKLERRTGHLVTLFDPLTSSIPSEIGPRWEGRWSACWFMHKDDDDFVPYVDDGITIEDVSPELGMVEGIGHSAYDEEGTYKLEGRMMSGRIVILTYMTPYMPLNHLEGVMMLRMDKMRNVGGWWMSNNEEAGGWISLERIPDNEPFEYQLHDPLTVEHT